MRQVNYAKVFGMVIVRLPDEKRKHMNVDNLFNWLLENYKQ